MTDDLVKRLRRHASWFFNSENIAAEAADRIEQIKELYLDYVDLSEERAARIKRLEAALENVMIGGNHLVRLIGTSPPHWTQEPCEALDWYGPNDAYDAWCCWKSIMEARAALGEKKDD